MQFTSPPEEPSTPAQIEAGDALIGAEAIAAFCGELLSIPVNVQTLYGWISRGLIPAGKFGSRVMGSKRAIREALARSSGLAA